MLTGAPAPLLRDPFVGLVVGGTRNSVCLPHSRASI